MPLISGRKYKKGTIAPIGSEQEIKSCYESGLSVNSIARKFKSSPYIIENILKDQNVKIRNRLEALKLKGLRQRKSKD